MKTFTVRYRNTVEGSQTFLEMIVPVLNSFRPFILTAWFSAPGANYITFILERKVYGAGVPHWHEVEEKVLDLTGLPIKLSDITEE